MIAPDAPASFDTAVRLVPPVEPLTQMRPGELVAATRSAHDELVAADRAAWARLTQNQRARITTKEGIFRKIDAEVRRTGDKRIVASLCGTYASSLNARGYSKDRLYNDYYKWTRGGRRWSALVSTGTVDRGVPPTPSPLSRVPALRGREHARPRPALVSPQRPARRLPHPAAAQRQTSPRMTIHPLPVLRTRPTPPMPLDRVRRIVRGFVIVVVILLTLLAAAPWLVGLFLIP